MINTHSYIMLSCADSGNKSTLKIHAFMYGLLCNSMSYNVACWLGGNKPPSPLPPPHTHTHQINIYNTLWLLWAMFLYDARHTFDDVFFRPKKSTKSYKVKWIFDWDHESAWLKASFIPYSSALYQIKKLKKKNLWHKEELLPGPTQSFRQVFDIQVLLHTLPKLYTEQSLNHTLHDSVFKHRDSFYPTLTEQQR